MANSWHFFFSKRKAIFETFWPVATKPIFFLHPCLNLLKPESVPSSPQALSGFAIVSSFIPYVANPTMRYVYQSTMLTYPRWGGQIFVS